MDRPFGVPSLTGKALTERFTLFTKKQFHRLVGLACAAVLSTFVLASPASADPYANVLVSSMQRTCDNIAAGINSGGAGIKLRANCLTSDGSRVPTSIDLRGVQRYGDNIALHPEVGFSSNLAGCAVTNTNPGTLDIAIAIRCGGTNSLIRVHELTNVDGSLRYETTKIWNLASKPKIFIDPDGSEEINEDLEEVETIEDQLLQVLSTNGSGEGRDIAFSPESNSVIALLAGPDDIPSLAFIEVIYETNGSGYYRTGISKLNTRQEAIEDFQELI